MIETNNSGTNNAYIREDIKINSFAKWDGAIGDLKNSGKDIEELNTKLSNIIKDKLTEYGITGPAAEKLLTSFENDVGVKSLNFLENYNQQVKVSEEDEQLAQGLVDDINSEWEGWIG